MDPRAAWEARYAREPAPWRGGSDEALDPWLAALPPGRCLDLGAGGGRTHRRLAALRAPGGASTVALDWVRASVAGLPSAVVADAAALPFRDGAFAAVVAVHALGHLDDVALPRAASEAARVLAPGGRLLVVEFAPGDLRAEAGEATPGGRRREGVLTRYVGDGEVAGWFAALIPAGVATVERRTPYGVRRRTLVTFGKP